MEASDIDGLSVVTGGVAENGKHKQVCVSHIILFFLISFTAINRAKFNLI